MTKSAHAARIKRAPLGENRVYGFQTIILRGDENNEGYLARLYAIGADGKVWTRTTEDKDRFFEKGAMWTEARCSPDTVENSSEFVGAYEADKIRKH